MPLTPSSQIGPILIGTVIDWFLLGTLGVQLYIFTNNQKAKKDAAWLRIIVYTIVVVNVFQTVLCTHFLWFFAVSHWGDKEVFASRSLTWTGQAIGPATGVVALLSQCTYSWRIWTIGQSYAFRALSSLATVLSLTQFSAFLAAIIGARIVKSGESIRSITVHTIIVELAGGFAADSLIAGSMFFLLLHARAHSAWANSRSLYDRLIFITVSTGLLTTTTAGVALGLFVHEPNNNAWYIPTLFISKLYGNSFIAALNDRFFRSEDSLYHGDPDQSLSTRVSRSVGAPTIQFSRGSRGEEGSAIELRVHGPERYAATNTTSTRMMSLESQTDATVDKASGEDDDESVLVSRHGKSDTLAHNVV